MTSCGSTGTRAERLRPASPGDWRRAIREARRRSSGSTETEPIDFFIYADSPACYAPWTGHPRERRRSTAHADIRTLFGSIPPNDVADRLRSPRIAPHELTHLVFDTAVSNPYHFPPRWLNEGLAVYLSEGFALATTAVDAAAGRGALMPLTALVGQFPTTYERFSLAYAESISAVDYLVRTYGRTRSWSSSAA